MSGVSPDGLEVLAIVDVASRWDLSLQEAERSLRAVGFIGESE